MTTPIGRSAGITNDHRRPYVLFAASDRPSSVRNDDDDRGRRRGRPPSSSSSSSRR